MNKKFLESGKTFNIKFIQILLYMNYESINRLRMM